MAINAPSINLLEDKNKGFLDKAINWSLTVGRIVVILTELIALSAFLYRFSLDRQLIDLHDEIARKQAIIKFYKINEEKYRNFQQRLALASKLTTAQNQMTKVFVDITSLSPNGISVDNLIVTKDAIKIDARASSVQALSTFITSLKRYPNITSVSLDKLENKTSNAIISVNISAKVKVP